MHAAFYSYQPAQALKPFLQKHSTKPLTTVRHELSGDLHTGKNIYPQQLDKNKSKLTQYSSSQRVCNLCIHNIFQMMYYTKHDFKESGAWSQMKIGSIQTGLSVIADSSICKQIHEHEHDEKICKKNKKVPVFLYPQARMKLDSMRQIQWVQFPVQSYYWGTQCFITAQHLMEFFTREFTLCLE